MCVGLSSPPAFSWHWWYVVMAIAVAVALAVLLAVYVTRLRRKETRFGWVVMRLLLYFPFSGHTHFAVFSTRVLMLWISAEMSKLLLNLKNGRKLID